MTGLLREVGRVRRAVEQFTEAAERIEAFSVRLEELPLLHAGDSFALLTGDSGMDAALSRQISQIDARAADQQPLPDGRGSDWRIAAPTRAATVRERSYERRARVDTTRFPIGAGPSGHPVRERLPAPGMPPVRTHEGVPFSNSTAVLAQRFEQAGLKTPWETAFCTAAEPLPVSEPVTQTATTHSPHFLRIVERAGRAGRARTPAQGSAGLSRRQIPMAAGDREYVPHRPLTPAEVEKLQAATMTAPASDSSPRQWPDLAVVTHDREWGTAADHDAVPRQRWVPLTGSGLRRLASLAGVLPGEPARERPYPHSAGATTSDADFVTSLEEALRAEAVRNGIDPGELIR